MVRNAGLTDPSKLPPAAEYSLPNATPPVPNTHPRVMAVLAFALYQVIAIIFFGRFLLGHFGSLLAGLLIITLLPNLDGSFWVRPLELPNFFLQAPSTSSLSRMRPLSRYPTAQTHR